VADEIKTIQQVLYNVITVYKIQTLLQGIKTTTSTISSLVNIISI